MATLDTLKRKPEAELTALEQFVLRHADDTSLTKAAAAELSALYAFVVAHDQWLGEDPLIGIDSNWLTLMRLRQELEAILQEAG